MVRLIKVATKKHLLVKGCHGQFNWLMYLQYYVYEISLKGGICHLFNHHLNTLDCNLTTSHLL